MAFSQPQPDPRNCGFRNPAGAPRLDVEVSGAGDGRELVLVKNGQRYVFRCAPGDEPDLLRRLSDLVRDPLMDLDWFDAAVLSHQIGMRLGKKLEKLREVRGS